MRADTKSRTVTLWRPLAITGLAIASIVLISAFYFARWVLLMACLGIGLGIILAPGIRWMQQRLRLSVAIGAFFFLILIVGSVSGLAFLVGSLIAEQIAPVLSNLPQRLAQIPQSLDKRLGDLPLFHQALSRLNLGDMANRLAGFLVQSAEISIVAMGAMLFIVVLGTYLAISPSQYLEGFVSLFPAFARERARLICLACAENLRKWFRFQLLTWAIVAVISGAGLRIIGIEQWLPLGIISGICEMIPYVGPLLSCSVALLVTLGTQPDKALWVLGLYVLIQQLEGNLINPIILKKGVKLPPVHVLLLILFMGNWFGFLGALVAPPLLAVGRALYFSLYLPHMNAWKTPPDSVFFPPEAAGADPSPLETIHKRQESA